MLEFPLCLHVTTANSMAGKFQKLAIPHISRGSQAGAIRAEPAASGPPIGPYGVLIAGQAKSRDLTLISRNVGAFSRVSGLRVENWET